MATEAKAAQAKAAPTKKEAISVEKKLEMSLGDIEKARPRQRKGVKAKKAQQPGEKAAGKSAQTKVARGKKLAGKRGGEGPNVVVSKPQQRKKEGGEKKQGGEKKHNPNLPRIVIKVDLTKVGGDKKPQQKKKQLPKKQGAKVVLH